MAYYKCLECPSWVGSDWGLLKGHVVKVHKRDDLKTIEDFKNYEITEEEYNKLKHPSLILQPPPGDNTNKAPLPPQEIITEYVVEPVTRLRQVLLVNGGQGSTVETVTKIMGLSPWLWGDPYQLENMLVSQFKTQQPLKGVQSCIVQYIRGVVVPEDLQKMSPYNYGQPNLYGQSGYGGFQYPNQPLMLGPYSPPAVSQEAQELRAELARLREDRQREEKQQLLNRINEMEKKLEGGGEVAKLQAQIEDLKRSLAGAGQATTMTIYDDKGNPMVLPYDRSYMAALNRKQEVETEAIRTEQMMKMLTLSGGNSDKYSPLMESLKKDMEAANKRVEDLTKAMMDQRIDHLEARVKAAEELAVSGGGDGRGILEVVEQAGTDFKEGAMAVGKEVKDSFDSGMKTIKEIVTNRPATVVNTTPRSPQEISAIMEAENVFLSSLGEQ